MGKSVAGRLTPVREPPLLSRSKLAGAGAVLVGLMLRSALQLHGEPAHHNFYPMDIAAGASGDVYVAYWTPSGLTGRVVRLDQELVYRWSWNMPGQAVGVAETPSGVVCALEWRFGFANDTTVLSCYSSIGTKLYEWEVSEEFIWEPAAPLVVDGSTDVWIAYEPTGPPPDYVRYYRSKVLRFTSDGRLRSQWYVDGRPRGLAVSDDGTVYLALSDADEQEGWVGLYDAHGEQLSRWPVDGVPGGVALDRNGGVTLTVRWPTGVPDQPAQGKIVRLTSAGSLWAEWAAPPSYYGIDVDQEDNVYSLEVREGGGRVLKYSPTGELMAVGPVAPQLQPLAYLPEAVKAGP